MTIFILLLAPLATAVSLSVPPPQSVPAHGDGRLVLYSYPHKEMLEVQYRRTDGTYDNAALARIAHVMRSPDGSEHPMDPRLIETIDAIQDHFGADTVEIISGYRSPLYNAELKSTGHHVARESLHMQGIATDIHLDEITERAVRDFAQSLQRGGVGYYPSLHFVHVDLGPVRQWAESEGPRKLVGVENNTGPCTITTERNSYLASTPETLVTIRGKTAECVAPKTIIFEYFHRGAWHSLPTRTFINPLPLGNLSAGKYRLRIADSLSNEFYMKTQ